MPVTRAPSKAEEDLWAGAKRGDAPAVATLLAGGVNVNAKTPYGVTALYIAAGKGHLDVVQLLIRHKANVNAADSFYSGTPLAAAADKGHAEVVMALLEAGATGADSLLVRSAKAERAPVVRAILTKGKPKPETLNRALEAVPSEHSETAELLKKAGARPAAGPAVTLDAASLTACTGVFENTSGSEVTVDLQDGKLVIRYAGQTLYTLKPTGPTIFQLRGESGTVTFKKDGDRVAGFSIKVGSAVSAYQRVKAKAAAASLQAALDETPAVVASPQNWPSFRGPQACGVADGQHPPVAWDAEKGTNVLWKTAIPGLGHSCPVIWGDHVYVTSAVSGDPNTKFRPGLYGDVDSVEDPTVHTWHVYCLDLHGGRILWDVVAHQGVPRIKRHTKGSHANCTPATDRQHVVVCFGSEGLYCYNPEGTLLWKRDLGVLDSGFFFDADYQWGFGSSPILYRNLVILQCDTGKNSFIAAYDVEDGRPVWQTPRQEIPSWGTPTVYEGPPRPELVTNATKFARGYDPLTGKELWRLAKNAEITVPTPVAGRGLIFVTSGYRPIQPIYAVRPGASGDISLKAGKDSSDFVAWSKNKGGPYMPTPIVYGDYLYTCSNNGLVACYEATTGKRLYQERLGGSGGYTASPVAADGKLYFTSEEAGVRVVRAGPKFEILATNPMGDVCMATPAISDGKMLVRTQHFLFGLGRKETSKARTLR
jgi:outer membrane protein assembly factor BamB